MSKVSPKLPRFKMELKKLEGTVNYKALENGGGAKTFESYGRLPRFHKPITVVKNCFIEC